MVKNTSVAITQPEKGEAARVRVPRNRPVERKRRKYSVIAFEMIRLDRNSPAPLQEQLYRQIRDEIESGSFREGSWRLPSSRDLAADLEVSRFTVKLVLERLRAEGYLRSIVGSGTFIADFLPEHFLKARKAASDQHSQPTAHISKRIATLPDLRHGSDFNSGIAGPPGRLLVAGIPAVDEFPLATWERLRGEVLAQRGVHLLRYAPSRGELDLRKAIAAYVCDFRGVRCNPDQVVIVSGMQQAMMVATLALVDPGEPVWIEDPGYKEARRVFEFTGARVVPRPVDAEGLVIAGSSRKNRPRIIFITPSAQFPMGVTMSAQRRCDLLAFAQEHSTYVLEDDYNSEFWFSGPPTPSLQGLDEAGVVIYAGTMSKILYPSLRLGYLIVPDSLVEPMIKTRSVLDQHSSPIDQSTLARFITEGFFLTHVKRIRMLYSERRAFFVEEFNRLLSRYFTLDVPAAGLHLVAWLKDPKDFPELQQFFLESQVRPAPLNYNCIEARLGAAFIFGFAAWTPAQIQRALLELASWLEQRRKTKNR